MAGVTGPELRWTSEPEQPEAVVLVLHGGRVRSEEAVAWRQLAVLRMAPFASAVARAGDGRLAVARLRLSVRGWNGGRPLVEGRWALERLRERYPGVPIGLLGHSMGGRTALGLSGEPDVAAVVVLATWLDQGDRLRPNAGLPVLLVHGDRDRVTSPQGSEVAAERLRAAGARVEHRVLPGEGHAMLRRAGTWHRLAADFLRDELLTPHP